MQQMDISNAIVKYGTVAVLRYRKVAGLLADDGLPEIFLGGVIACGIHDELHMNAHVERFYTAIVGDLGMQITPELVNSFGGYRADVAVYRDRRPTAIVELKVFGDGKRPAGIVADRDKMIALSRLCNVESYLGVLVTDDKSGALCSERVRLLEIALEKKFLVVGDNKPSFDGTWNWRFASGRFA
jgi:hypothetical protein